MSTARIYVTKEPFSANSSLNLYFSTIASSRLADYPFIENSREEEFPQPKTLNPPRFGMTKLCENDVYKALSTINVIKTKALKLTAPHIFHAVTHLFNESFAKGLFPTSWKIAKVIYPRFQRG